MAWSACVHPAAVVPHSTSPQSANERVAARRMDPRVRVAEVKTSWRVSGVASFWRVSMAA
ncbi:hypothetical protein ACFQYP_29630 [Nonomuraea antimicrobica]